MPEPDDPGYALAQNLASVLEYPEVRTFVKEKVLERFDGDYDILYTKVKNEPIQSGINRRSSTFEELLFGKQSSNMRIANKLLNDPLIQIAMPELPETSAHEWDTEL